MNTLLSIAFTLMLIATFIQWCGLKCRDDVIANKDALIDALRTNVAELVHQREDLQRQVEMKNKQVDGHIRDATLLNAEVQWLRSRKDIKRELDVDEVMAEVHELLETA